MRLMLLGHEGLESNYAAGTSKIYSHSVDQRQRLFRQEAQQHSSHISSHSQTFHPTNYLSSTNVTGSRHPSFALLTSLQSITSPTRLTPYQTIILSFS